MEKYNIEEWAVENNLDVREIQPYHLRLMDSLGKFILDVYIKKNKKGNIVKNTTFCFKNQKWGVAINTNDLMELI